MEIMSIPFEKELKIKLADDRLIELYAFKTDVAGNVKLGVKAPRHVSEQGGDFHFKTSKCSELTVLFEPLL